MNDMPWIKSYPEGVRWDVEHRADAGAADPGRRRRQLAGQPGDRLHGQAHQLPRAAGAGATAPRGASRSSASGPASMSASTCPTRRTTSIAFFGVLKAGGTVVNYSPLDAARCSSSRSSDSRTDILVTLDVAALYPKMAAMRGKTRLKKLIVGSIAEYLPWPRTGLSVADEGGQSARPWPRDDWHRRLRRAARQRRRVSSRIRSRDPAETMAVLQYTGGTTGLPKGAMLTHGCLIAACSQYWPDAGGTPPVLDAGQRERAACCRCSTSTRCREHAGRRCATATELILHPRFDIEVVAEGPREQEGDASSPACRRCTPRSSSIPSGASSTSASLKFCMSGGAPLPLEVAAELREADRRHPDRGLGPDRDLADRHASARSQGSAQGRLVRRADAAASIIEIRDIENADARTAARRDAARSASSARR